MPVIRNSPRAFAIQVRASIGAAALAAAVPAFVVSMFTIGVMMPSLSGVLAYGPQHGAHTGYAGMLVLPAQVMVTTLLAMFVPSLIVVGLTHALARSLRRTRPLDYAMIGAAVGVTASMAMAAAIPIMLLAVFGTLIGGVMGFIYRRFAGTKPLRRRDDVRATNPEALAAEDHPARKAHAVVVNG